MTWNTRRQLTIIGIIVIFLAGIGFLFVKPYLFKDPTCFDGKQNGIEIGIDCGGGCDLVCSVSIVPLSVKFAREAEIIPGRYNAVAYVENNNKNAGIASMNYEFRLYDASDILVARRTGKTFIDSNGINPIFEGGISTGNIVPVRTTFKFLTENPVWTTIDAKLPSALVLTIQDKFLTDTNSEPRLVANMVNTSLFSLKNVDVVAIVYDANKNVITTSATYVEVVGPQASVPVSFTWPRPFPKEAVITEIIPRVNRLAR
jgi:hypothetical protein